MSVTVADLATYIGVDPDSEDATQEMRLSRALSMAEVVTDDALCNAFREVPETVRDQIVFEVGHAYYKRADAVSGAGQFGFANSESTPVFEPKDALSKVRGLIARYVIPF